MICPVCNTENMEDHKYCKACGAPLDEKTQNYQKTMQAATLLENEGKLDEAIEHIRHRGNHAQRQYGLRPAIPSLLGRSAGAIALDDEQFAFGGVGR